MNYVQEEDAEEVARCLEQMNTSEINTPDENGMVKSDNYLISQGALHWSARTGSKEISKLLLKVKGIKVNNQDSLGWTALHVFFKSVFKLISMLPMVVIKISLRCSFKIRESM